MEKEYTYEDLTALVQRLKKNEESVPKELLKTKYAEGYARLRNNIRTAAEGLMRADVFCGFGINPVDTSILPGIQSLIQEEEKEGGIIGKASKALFKRYDVEEFKSLVGQMREKVWAVYEPYWTKYFYKQKIEQIKNLVSIC